MTETQNTIFGTSEPVAPHRDDLIDCSDDTVCRHEDVCYDVVGCAHSNNEDRRDANIDLVRVILKDTQEWSEDYHTNNSDFPDDISHIVNETSHGWPDRVKEWIQNEYEDIDYNNPHADYMDELVAHVCEGLDGTFDAEAEHSCNEYACYSGDGCCLYSFGVGECEEQIDINSYPELKALHEKHELDDVLDELERDFCIGRSRRREKNEKTGCYENVGRNTYMPSPTDYPTFEIYTMPGGQWHYVVDAEYMNDLVNEFLEERNGSDD